MNKHKLSRMLAAASALALVGLACGNAASQDAKAITGTPPAPSAFHNITVWAQVVSSGAWTAVAIDLIRTHLPSLEKARDIAQFCPSYSQATRVQKETCWLRLIGGIVKFESGFHPGEMYRESTGQYSIGLMSLSPGECPDAPKTADLKDPLRNLICGVKMMAGLVARDGYLDGPSGQRGAGAYWSVIRKKYGRHGKKEQIIQLTSPYRQLSPS